MSSDFKFGDVVATDGGFSVCTPHERSLQVFHLSDGSVTVTLAETGKQNAMFDLSRQHARRLALLLCPELAAPAEAERKVA